MKNLIFLLVLFICISVKAQDPAYMQWQNILITPNYDQLQQFGEALHAHNKKYHQDAASAASVWRITSGPNVGKWIFSMGPYTFSGMDTSPLGDDHLADWRNNVMPYIDKVEDGGTWRVVNENSHLPQVAPITKARVIIHTMSGEGGEGYQSAMRKLAEATAKTRPNTPRIFLRRVGFNNDHKDNVVFIGLNKWADLDSSNIVSAYEEVHGEGSWDLFLEEVGDAIESSFEEHWVHVPYLSGQGGDE